MTSQEIYLGEAEIRGAPLSEVTTKPALDKVIQRVRVLMSAVLNDPGKRQLLSRRFKSN